MEKNHITNNIRYRENTLRKWEANIYAPNHWNQKKHNAQWAKGKKKKQVTKKPRTNNQSEETLLETLVEPIKGK